MSVRDAKFYPENQSGIANLFSILASSSYEVTLKEIQDYKKKLRLNDWGVYLLVKKLSQTFYKDENEANIYLWFMLTKLSYDVKIALDSSNKIQLLHYSKSIIYATPRYSFDKKYYYNINQSNKYPSSGIYTYLQEYHKAVNPLDFSLKKLPLLGKNSTLKSLSFSDFGIRYRFNYHYNRYLVDFMQTYPQVDYKIYFTAPMQEETYRDLAKDIKKYVDGKKMSEALNFVLHFVQKAFKYQRDYEQFGYEKVMFAEETLTYTASDCEDRAILFAYLVRRLFGIRAIALKYPDHISTALYIPMQGDSVYPHRRRYVVADPTYINANIGQQIPKYRDIEPQYYIQLTTIN
jgi:hypothetical protein